MSFKRIKRVRFSRVPFGDMRTENECNGLISVRSTIIYRRSMCGVKVNTIIFIFKYLYVKIQQYFITIKNIINSSSPKNFKR